ncbi:hypothetical protein JQ604_25985 [Bradyrhizobium jicamae]|uniref:hypothetical protein n=1 Tax=Bradyrhizobium jicamae TaxID=280332 RepID=UPI001BABDCEB|nr:hypothetical protein [Bradyrhizobium jicamae]MBR0755643.1 hypothetical protein [Bradyrhizobium jicamae]
MASEGLIPSSTPEQRIEQASEAIRHMAEDDFQPLLPTRNRWLHHLAEATRAAPLQSLAVAFLVGFALAHR